MWAGSLLFYPFFIHAGCCLSCCLNLLGNSVLYGCERSHSDGCFLKCSWGACWSSFKRVALHNHSKSTQMALRAARGFSAGDFRCRLVYILERDHAILMCSDCWNAFLMNYRVSGGIGCEQAEVLKPRMVPFIV